MSGHTPGPWHLEFDEDETPTVYVDANVGRFEIASEVGGEVRQDEEGDWSDFSEVHANARLIAAAPELLEALKALLSAFDATGKRLYSISGKPTSRDLSVAAIAKAEGKQ